MRRKWRFRGWMYPTIAMAVVLMALSIFFSMAVPMVRVGCFIGLVLICFVLAQAGGVKLRTWPWPDRSEKERCF